MKYIIEMDIPQNKLSFVKEFLSSLTFVKNVKMKEFEESSSNSLHEAIEAYETGKIQATPMSLTELKEMLNA